MLMKKQISDFQANGVVLLKGVLNDFVNDARVAIEENMAQPSWRERTYHKDDGSAPFFQDYVVWNPRFLAAMILSGSAVHLNGLASLSLYSAMKRLIAA